MHLKVTKAQYLASHAECTLLMKCCCLLRICRERVAAIILAVVYRFTTYMKLQELRHTRFSELMFDARELLDFSSICAFSLNTTINLFIWSLM